MSDAVGVSLFPCLERNVQEKAENCVTGLNQTPWQRWQEPLQSLVFWSSYSGLSSQPVTAESLTSSWAHCKALSPNLGVTMTGSPPIPNTETLGKEEKPQSIPDRSVPVLLEYTVHDGFPATCNCLHVNENDLKITCLFIYYSFVICMSVLTA